MTRYKRRTSAAALAGILHLPEETMSPTKTNSPDVHHRSSGYNVNATLLVCPITGYPCEGDLSYLCEDYGCARKGGLSPRSDENS